MADDKESTTPVVDKMETVVSEMEITETTTSADDATMTTNGVDELKNEDKDLHEINNPAPIKSEEGIEEKLDDAKETKTDDDDTGGKKKKKKETASTASSAKKRKKSTEGDEPKTTIATETADTTTSTTPATSTSRVGRERKSVETFNPDSYDKPDKKTVQIIDGRGSKLRNLSSTFEKSMEKQSTEEIAMAHKLIFTHRYKVTKHDMIQQILDFSGYLPKKDPSLSKADQEKLDDELEAKLGAKAYKMTIPELKKLCDFFMVDRYATPTKDGLVDKLLDFLGAPNKSHLTKKGTATSKSSTTSGSKSKSKTTKSKKKATKADEGDDDEEEEEEEEEDEDDGKEAGGDDYDDVDDDKMRNENGDKNEPKLPSNDTLRKWVRAYVRCFHENKLTVNHALEIGSEKFGIDLLPKKADLKKLLIDEL